MIISLQTKRFYYTEGDPIYLLTDARDYGIGEYLYQLIDNVENLSPLLGSHSLDLNSVGQQSRKKRTLSSIPFVNSDIYWEIEF